MKLILGFFLFFFSLDLCAQEQKPFLISGDFWGITIDEFVKQVEAKTTYHFYFDPKQFDLLIINADVKDRPLTNVLNEIFKNSDYSYAIDNNRVFC